MSAVLPRLLLAASLMLLAPLASAQPVKPAPGDVVTAPNWSTGSNWYYSDGYALKVTAVTDGNTQFDRLDAQGQWFSRHGFLRQDLVSGTATRNTVYRTISDQAGLSLSAATPLTFQREYLSNGQLMVHASSWSVEGRETITVPAGTFDCWIIVWRSRSLRSDWTGFERWWYSPLAQNYVRMEYKYGADQEGSRVLMRYSLTRAEPRPAPVNLSHSAPEAAPPLPIHADLAPAAEPVMTAEAEPPRPPARRVAAAPVMAALPQFAAIMPELPATPPDKKAHAPAPTARPVKMAAKALPVKAVMPVPGPFVWHAQLASSRQQDAIHRSLDKFLHQQAEALHDLPSGVTPAEIAGRGTFYRAWVGNFADAHGAATLCKTLDSQGMKCSVFRQVTGNASG